MNITSEKFPALKQFNRKAGHKRHIRIGVSVTTSRGPGIVTWRRGATLEVAVRPDRADELLPCYRYWYEINDVELRAEPIAKTDRLHAGAWYWIMNAAINDNIDYEDAKHRAIFEEYEWRIPGNKTDRTISLGEWGSTTYRRYTGVNKHGQPFDFELSLRPGFPFPYGDHILYALGENDGFVSDMNGHGWIYRRPIEDRDINYGLCKYATPQEEAE